MHFRRSENNSARRTTRGALNQSKKSLSPAHFAFESIPQRNSEAWIFSRPRPMHFHARAPNTTKTKKKETVIIKKCTLSDSQNRGRKRGRKKIRKYCISRDSALLLVDDDDDDVELSSQSDTHRTFEIQNPPNCARLSKHLGDKDGDGGGHRRVRDAELVKHDERERERDRRVAAASQSNHKARPISPGTETGGKSECDCTEERCGLLPLCDAVLIYVYYIDTCIVCACMYMQRIRGSFWWRGGRRDRDAIKSLFEKMMVCSNTGRSIFIILMSNLTLNVEKYFGK